MGFVSNSGIETKIAFEDVAEEVSNFVNAFVEISQSTSEVSEGNREILNAVESLMQISQGITDGSSNIKLSSEEINKAVSTIKEASKRVVYKVLNVKSGLGDITNAQDDMIRTVDWNSKSIKTIEKNLSYFEISDDVEIPDESKLNLQITELLVHHQKWLADVSRAIGGSMKLDVEEASRYKTCNLGNWLYGEGLEKFEDNELFQKITKDHINFHAAVSSLAENLEQSNFSEVFANYARIHEDFNSIVLNFRKLLDI